MSSVVFCGHRDGNARLVWTGNQTWTFRVGSRDDAIDSIRLIDADGVMLQEMPAIEERDHTYCMRAHTFVRRRDDDG